MVPTSFLQPLQYDGFAFRCPNKDCGSGADWIIDSGASKHFTSYMNDFVSFEPLAQDNTTLVNMASGTVHMAGRGAVFIRHVVLHNGKEIERTTCLFPV